MGLKVPSAASSVEVDFKNPKRSKQSQRPFLICLGSKGTGKTSCLSTIPKREGSKHLFLTADSNTENGLLTFWTDKLGSLEKAREWLDENAVIIELTALYDPSDVSTAPGTVDYIVATMKKAQELGKEEPWAGVFLEHYDYLMDSVGVDLIRHEKNLAKDERPHFQHYGIRNTLLDPVDSALENINCDVLALSSYWDGPQEKVVPNPDKPGKTMIEMSNELPRWMTKRKLARNSQVRIIYNKTVDEKEVGDRTVKVRKHFAEVDYSTLPHFKEGTEKDITGTGLAPFFEGDWWQERLKGGSK